MTTPEAAAMIGAPYPAPMSIPSCMRPQRIPNGLVTGPLTGQMRPDADGVPGDTAGGGAGSSLELAAAAAACAAAAARAAAAAASAARILSASSLLTCASASISA